MHLITLFCRMLIAAITFSAQFQLYITSSLNHRFSALEKAFLAMPSVILPFSFASDASITSTTSTIDIFEPVCSLDDKPVLALALKSAIELITSYSTEFTILSLKSLEKTNSVWNASTIHAEYFAKFCLELLGLFLIFGHLRSLASIRHLSYVTNLPGSFYLPQSTVKSVRIDPLPTRIEMIFEDTNLDSLHHHLFSYNTTSDDLYSTPVDQITPITLPITLSTNLKTLSIFKWIQSHFWYLAIVSSIILHVISLVIICHIIELLLSILLVTFTTIIIALSTLLVFIPLLGISTSPATEIADLEIISSLLDRTAEDSSFSTSTSYNYATSEEAESTGYSSDSSYMDEQSIRADFKDSTSRNLIDMATQAILRVESNTSTLIELPLIITNLAAVEVIQKSTASTCSSSWGDLDSLFEESTDVIEYYEVPDEVEEEENLEIQFISISEAIAQRLPRNKRISTLRICPGSILFNHRLVTSLERLLEEEEEL